MTSKVQVNSQFLQNEKFEGGGRQSCIAEKLTLKIQTVEDIDVKMTQNDFEDKRDGKKVLIPCSVCMAGGLCVHC